MKKTFLMCQPTFYGVDYVINPHMEGNVGKVDRELAHKQWKNLYSIVSSLANVETIDQAPGLPDMVFTANAGLVFRELGYVWLSRFAKPERRGEERLFAGWFIAAGLDIISQPPAQMNFFEGAGDALIDHNGEYWVGHGTRSTLRAVEALINFFDKKTFHPLELKDPRFYHLDTCFCPLSRGHTLWYPGAFTDGDAPLPDLLIDVDEDDALRFACNSICIDNVVIMPSSSPHLKSQVEKLGYEVIHVDLSEFIKAGGAAKCLTLQVR